MSYSECKIHISTNESNQVGVPIFHVKSKWGTNVLIITITVAQNKCRVLAASSTLRKLNIPRKLIEKSYF